MTSMGGRMALFIATEVHKIWIPILTHTCDGYTIIWGCGRMDGW